MKIKISKQIWLQMAKKAGWFRKIRMASNGQEEIFEIGGKYYTDRNGETIEVNPPQLPASSPKSITVSTRWGDITFTEGAIEENFFGKYRIISLNSNNTMTIEYTEVKDSSIGVGEQKTYPTISQAEAILREKSRKEREMRYKQIEFGKSEEFFAIGFLAKYGRIRVEVPAPLKDRFDMVYKRFTGEDPDRFLGHGYAANLNPETKGNSWELRISFPNPGPGILRKMNFSKCPPIPAGRKLEINYNNYVMNLFRLGFTIGPNEQNIAKILNAVNGAEEKKSFINGTRVFEALENIKTDELI